MIVGLLGQGQIGMTHTKNALKLGHEVVFYDPAKPSALADEGECISLADAIIIASPSSLHARHIEMCAEAGKPMLVEKPISTSMDDWTKDAIANSLVMVANNCRYHPVVKVVKERMHELGGPYHGAWFRLHQEKKDAKDPVILNWGAHEADLALYLLDKKLTVMQGHSKVEHDRAEFILRFQSGPLVHMDLSYHGPDDRCFTIHGPDASIHADLDNFTVHIFSRQGREIIAVEGSHEQTYVDEMKEFIKRVESGGASTDGIGATGEDGLRCLKVLLEAQNA